MNTSKPFNIPTRTLVAATSFVLLFLVFCAGPALADPSSTNLGGMPAHHSQPNTKPESAGADAGPLSPTKQGSLDNPNPKQRAAHPGTNPPTNQQENTQPQGKNLGAGPGSGSDGGISGLIAGAFFGLMGKIYEYTVGALLKFLAANVGASALSLPDLTNSQVVSLFDKVSMIFKPLAVVALLYAGYMMMFKGAEYDAHYFIQHSMGKFGVVVAGVAFMPEIAHIFSGISTNIAHGVGAGASLNSIVGQNIKDAYNPTDFLHAIAGIALAVALVILWVVSWMVKIGFVLLFITAAPALFAWLFPGISGLAGAWFRGFIACFAIPALYSLELMIGSWVVKSPQILFGSSAGKGGAEALFSSVALIIVIYLLLKTPKQVLSWAFSSYSPGDGLGKRIATSYAVNLATKGLGKGGG